MARPSSAKTRRRTHNNHNNRKVRRTQTRRGGVPKVTNASYWNDYVNPYLRPPSTSHMDSTFSRSGLKGHHQNAMKRLEKELIQLEVELEHAGLTRDEINTRLEAHKAKRLQFIDKWTPNPNSSMFSRVSSVIGKFKKRSELVYTPAELRNDRTWPEITEGMSLDGISTLRRVRFNPDINKITKNPNGNIFIHYRNSHPLLGERGGEELE